MHGDSWVLAWWALMSGIGTLNIGLWVYSARRFAREGTGPHWFRRRHLILSGIYAFICAFRSMLPRADVQRICLVDSWWSTILVGRSVATIAELSFVAQWALLLREYGEAAGSRVVAAVSRLIVPLIGFAECCSWYAVLNTNYLGNTFEESTWTVTATLTASGMVLLRRRAAGSARTLLTVGVVLTIGYVAFMTNVDVPMYFNRWRADEAAHRAYFSIGAGLHDVATRWVPDRSFEAWRTEMPWMGLYFSIAVWASLYLTHAPRWRASLK
jgi:hypothetical protein